MSSWIDILANRERLQRALNTALALDPPLDVDGDLGPLSLKALQAAETKFGIPVSTSFDNRILPYLHLTQESAVTNTNIFSGIGATAADYFLNFISSKINWTAAAMVAVVVGWISTKFGFTVPDGIQQEVTGLLVTGFAAVIALLRTFFNSPKVINGTVVK